VKKSNRDLSSRNSNPFRSNKGDDSNSDRGVSRKIFFLNEPMYRPENTYRQGVASFSCDALAMISALALLLGCGYGSPL
jgi:hypothetical protein